MKYLLFLVVCVSFGAQLSCSSTDTPSGPGPDMGKPTVDAAAWAPEPKKGNCAIDRPFVPNSGDSSGVGKAKSALVGGTDDPTGIALTAGQQAAAGALVVWYDGVWSRSCSATLVSDRVVITAAHCVATGYRDPPPLEAHRWATELMSFSLGSDVDNAQARIKVKEVHIHPEARGIFGDFRVFRSSLGVEHDLAVLILEQPASAVLPSVEPIPVNTTPLQEVLGGDVVLGGFGVSVPIGQKDPQKRHWSHLRLEVANAEYYGVRHLDQAYSTGGDSGGGMWMKFPDGQVRLIGTVNGPLYAAKIAQGVFGPRVDRQYAWLQQFLGDACGEVTAAGQCDGDRVRRCAEGRIVAEDCSADGKVCDEDSCGQLGCVAPASKPADPQCKDLDYFGRCSGDNLLEWCVDGRYQQRHCPRDGMRCGASGDAKVGNTCIDPDPASGQDGSPGDASDGGPAGDATGDATAAALLSCGQLQQCGEACNGDMWCGLNCVVDASTEAKRLWFEASVCIGCAMRGDSGECIGKPVGKCVDVCTPPIQEPKICLSCVAEACSKDNDACSAHGD